MNLDGGEYVVSIDKIDPGLDYSPGNIQLLCWCVNRAKGAMLSDSFLNMCRAIVRCNDYPEREYGQVAGSA